MKATDTRLLSTAVLAAAASRLAVDAFHQPLIRPILSSKNIGANIGRVRSTIRFSSIDDDVSSDIAALDSELAAEIDAALELAQQAIDGSTEEGLDEIANLLMEAPPNLIPTPPKDAPTETVIESLRNEESEGTIELTEKQPTPPTSPPPPKTTASFGETLQKAAMEEAEKLKKLLFGLKGDISETESRTEEAKGTADALKQEIEASIKERDATVKNIENEFAAEKERLVQEIGTASEDLQLVIDQSAKNITDAQLDVDRADEALVSTMDSLTSAIQKITSEVMGTEKEKEEIQQTKQSRLDKIMQEAKENMIGLKKTLEFESAYINRVNAELVQMKPSLFVPFWVPQYQKETRKAIYFQFSCQHFFA